MLRSIAKRSTFGIYLESVITRHVDFVCCLNLQFSQVFDNLGSSEFVGEKLCLKNIVSTRKTCQIDKLKILKQPTQQNKVPFKNLQSMRTFLINNEDV